MMKWLSLVENGAAQGPGARRSLSGHLSSRYREAVTRISAGFTLIELMVVVAIVAVLTAIAYPAYTSYITRTHRVAAESCLSQYSNYMERFYTTNLRYDEDTAGTANTLPAIDCASSQQTGANYDYDLPASSLSVSTYVVRAVPTGSQLSRDTECGTLSLDQTGARKATGSGARCW
jgi:type IV pilus assembly protein PilE